MKDDTIHVHVCVVGGGMAGLLAAISAARHGASVALIQDRPVLGGNASSEIRMHICGAHGENVRETGILEEILLENLYRNPTVNYSIWDSVLYGKAQYQENLQLFLNTTVLDATMDGDYIKDIKAWQLTTETRLTIEAEYFIDASGDGILAPLSGAEFRRGREARSEYNESLAPEVADSKTMGLTCLFQAREYPREQKFIPPSWAYVFKTPEDIQHRNCHIKQTNFWWMELGGTCDSIHDTEKIREELVRIAFGVWNYIKNYSPQKEEFRNWALDWMGFLPGKRESRRYIGDHVLTQNDILNRGQFDDTVAYGGWTMDDHFPEGFRHPKTGTTFHATPSPYGIPYRSLYSRNIMNLFCVGRCHSATHMAMSSTRVMATTSLMGQAAGTAAALAHAKGISPREVGQRHIRELQQTLMDDDCFLPGHLHRFNELTMRARFTTDHGDPSQLLNGYNRPWNGQTNAWEFPCGAHITLNWDHEVEIEQLRIVFDSDLNRKDPGRGNRRMHNMRHYYSLDDQPWAPPSTLVKAFRVEALDASGQWQTVLEEKNNYQRLYRARLAQKTKALRIHMDESWGDELTRIFELSVQ
ncbi:MAG: FAD-dependent oxidoreductase [Lentisphaerae bacterium]|nr:MAG: FAD-dependent oxidoreductase [Lentisphaerota bacterium]